jgi:squalene-hopene/tetraprenyl-beta-curcumene cyclase
MSFVSAQINTELQERVQDAIRRAQQHLLRQQNLDGYWWAELEANVTITAEYIMLHRILGTERERRIAQARRYLLREQRPHGGWELFWRDGGELSTTIEAYFALKLAGEPVDSEAMMRARRFVLDRGGVTKARVFTKIHLALFGAYPWKHIPALPAWFMLLPQWFPFNIYEMASWARSSTVPLLIVSDRKSVFECDVKAEELFVDHDMRLENRDGSFAGSLFLFADRVLKLADRLGFVPLRQKAIDAAERWILERQEPSGDWAGIIPAMLNSLLALKVLGYSNNHPCVKRGIEAIEQFGIEESGVEGVEEAAYFRLQPCVSPTWDTALAMTALIDSGLAREHPALRQAGEWLLSQQIFTYGDWAIRNRSGRPGGWAFEFHNDHYPDVDDTAAVVLALLSVKLKDEESKLEACRAAIRWVVSMQCRAGGWAAFDIDNTQDLFNRMPYGDLKAMIDPPTADLTGRVLEMTARFRSVTGETIVSDSSVSKAEAFLARSQEGDGSWWGRWGVNYIYGTYLSLIGAKATGATELAGAVERGVRWLKQVQNDDGGWGESCESYRSTELKGEGASTPSQTAWALLGLMASGYAGSSTVLNGIEYLIRAQNPDGSWNEDAFTGTGFPGHFYIRYHLYKDIFPLTALGRFLGM